MESENPNQLMKALEASVPFGSYVESSEIADMALILASDESKSITGCTHVVDGGMLTA
jgi:enoyl-[acyl-carrier-protein] reductase (NADH)